SMMASRLSWIHTRTSPWQHCCRHPRRHHHHRRLYSSCTSNSLQGPSLHRHRPPLPLMQMWTAREGISKTDGRHGPWRHCL
ncbi:unnamed protein product, partial [Candidula unifasciata]